MLELGYVKTVLCCLGFFPLLLLFRRNIIRNCSGTQGALQTLSERTVESCLRKSGIQRHNTVGFRTICLHPKKTKLPCRLGSTMVAARWREQPRCLHPKHPRSTTSGRVRSPSCFLRTGSSISQPLPPRADELLVLLILPDAARFSV